MIAQLAHLGVRLLAYGAYLLSYAAAHHAIGMGWAAWQHIPYGGILAMERANINMRGALGLEELFLAALIGVPLLGLLVRLRRRALDRRWLAEPIREERTVLPDGARWATERELRRYQRCAPSAATPMSLGEPLAFIDGVWARAGGWLSLPWTLLNQSVLDVAPSGAGKTVHIVGCVLRLAQPGRRLWGLLPLRDRRFSLFVWDVKGELEALLAPWLRAIGYVVTVLHPFEAKDRVNPVVWLENARYCDLFWEAWLANSDSAIGSKTAEEAHEDWSRTLLTGMTLALRTRHGPTACTLPLIFDAFKAGDQAIYDLLKTAPDGGSGADMWLTLMKKGGTAFSNQKGSLTMRGELFKDPEPRAFCSGHDVDLLALYGVGHAPPHALFFQIPSAMQTRVLPLTAGITAVIFARAQEVAQGKRLPRRLLCIFDEFGTSATIPKAYDWLNLLRGTGVAWWVVVQYLDQLRQKYGKDGATGIKVGCGTWLGRGGMREEDAAEFSVRMGVQNVQVRTLERMLDERGRRVEREKSRHTERPPLLHPDLIRHLPEWCLLVVPRALTWPFVTLHPPYYEDECLAQRAARPAAPTIAPSQPLRKEEETLTQEEEEEAPESCAPTEELIAVGAVGPVPFRY